jgi:hypothetical protein
LYGAGVAGVLYCAVAVNPLYIGTARSIALAHVENNMSTPYLAFRDLASPSVALPLRLSVLLLEVVAQDKLWGVFLVPI